MNYTIESKNDLQGASIIIRFPEKDLDKKALYTINNDQPKFLVPFKYRSMDGMAECSYALENRTKLQYRFGTHQKDEYIDFWGKILEPLVECDDYFLKPYSFVMDSRYIYVDKQGVISYLYVPSLEDAESYESLQAFVMDLSNKNNVSDASLENKVLRSIIQDFRPKAFLDMLRTSGGASVLKSVKEPERPAPFVQPKPPVEQPKPFIEPTPPVEPPKEPPMESFSDGDIHINFGGGKKEKPPKEKKPLFGGKKEKTPKEKPVKEKPVKEKKSLFGGKKESPQKDLVLGAAASMYEEKPAPSYSPMEAARVSYEIDDGNDITQLDDGDFAVGAARLRLVGNQDLPREIAVDINVGQSFTIGRFDASIGRKQSDFEFVKTTKAVSRRHAAIEREENGYFLVDLASSAGTYINGKRLTPNVPELITNGSEIRFGTSGANYEWME